MDFQITFNIENCISLQISIYKQVLKIKIETFKSTKQHLVKYKAFHKQTNQQNSCLYSLRDFWSAVHLMGCDI